MYTTHAMFHEAMNADDAMADPINPYNGMSTIHNTILSRVAAVIIFLKSFWWPVMFNRLPVDPENTPISLPKVVMSSAPEPATKPAPKSDSSQSLKRNMKSRMGADAQKMIFVVTFT